MGSAHLSRPREGYDPIRVATRIASNRPRPVTFVETSLLSVQHFDRRHDAIMLTLLASHNRQCAETRQSTGWLDRSAADEVRPFLTDDAHELLRRSVGVVPVLLAELYPSVLMEDNDKPRVASFNTSPLTIFNRHRNFLSG